MNRFPLYALAAVLALGLGAVFTGCDAAFSEAPAPPARPAAFDGETLLRGVAFGQGPVAEMLPEVWGTPAAAEALATASAEDRRRIEYLVRRVHESDSDLLTRLEADMVSGEVHRVLASLDATAAVLTRHLDDASRRGGDAQLGMVIDGQGVVIESPVCLVALCAVVAWYPTLEEGSALTDQTTLAREEIAYNLTQRLAGRSAVPRSH